MNSNTKKYFENLIQMQSEWHDYNLMLGEIKFNLNNMYNIIRGIDISKGIEALNIDSDAKERLKNTIERLGVLNEILVINPQIEPVDFMTSDILDYYTIHLN